MPMSHGVRTSAAATIRMDTDTFLSLTSQSAFEEDVVISLLHLGTDFTEGFLSHADVTLETIGSAIEFSQNKKAREEFDFGR